MTIATTLKPDPMEISRGLDVLFDHGDVIELRAFKGNRRCTVSGYFDDFDLLASAAVNVSHTAGGVYVVLNEIKPELLARRCNHCEDFASTTTADDQITRQRWLPIDVDAKRPAGISSSEEEHEAAIQKARDIRTFLVKRLGWPEPVAADSGNGGHLLFKIDLPNDHQATELVQKCLQALDLRFSDDRVAIDTGVYNAARIWKLYGTVAGKGDSTPESRAVRSPEL